MRVKPSKWVVVFFVLLILGVAVKFGLARRERTQLKKVAPHVEMVRRFLRCMAGRDVQRVMGPYEDNVAEAWAKRLDARLSSLMTSMPVAQSEADWPVRCLPLAETVIDEEERLSVAQSARLTTFRARLRKATWNHMELIGFVDSGDLAIALAGLAANVVGRSPAARQTWDAILAPDKTDLYPVPADQFPQPHGIVEGLDHAVLLTPSLLAWQSTTGRQLHLSSMSDDGSGFKSDRVLGLGAPVLDADARQDVVRVAQDGGDALLLVRGQPKPLIPFPDAIRNGTESVAHWDVLFSDRWLWLLTTDVEGALHLRRMALSGGPWNDVELPENKLNWQHAMLVARQARDGVDVAGVVRTPRGVEFARVLGVAGEGEVADVPAVAGNTRMDGFGAWTVSCVAEHARYILVSQDKNLHVWRVSDRDASVLELGESADEVEGATYLSCNDKGLLAFTSGRLAMFDFHLKATWKVEPPAFESEYNPTRVVAATLTRNHTVLAVGIAMNVMRVWRQDVLRPVADASVDPRHWNAGAWLGRTVDLQTQHREDRNAGSGYRVEASVGPLVVEGEHVGLLAHVRFANKSFVSRFISHDRAESFWNQGF